MSEHTTESAHRLTDAEKRLRDWLMTHPEGGEMWMIIKGGFRRSYRLGQCDALDDVDRRLTARIGEGRDDPETSREVSYFSGFLDALESARAEVRWNRPDVPCSPAQPVVTHRLDCPIVEAATKCACMSEQLSTPPE